MFVFEVLFFSAAQLIALVIVPSFTTSAHETDLTFVTGVSVSLLVCWLVHSLAPTLDCLPVVRYQVQYRTSIFIHLMESRESKVQCTTYSTQYVHIQGVLQGPGIKVLRFTRYF